MPVIVRPFMTILHILAGVCPWDEMSGYPINCLLYSSCRSAVLLQIRCKRLSITIAELQMFTTRAKCANTDQRDIT